MSAAVLLSCIDKNEGFGALLAAQPQRPRSSVFDLSALSPSSYIHPQANAVPCEPLCIASLDPKTTWVRKKLLLKGIDTADDAKLAREHGADRVIVSNHGGRATETGRGTIDILPEVAQFPVFVDGGFRRGSEVAEEIHV